MTDKPEVKLEMPEEIFTLDQNYSIDIPPYFKQEIRLCVSNAQGLDGKATKYIRADLARPQPAAVEGEFQKLKDQLAGARGVHEQMQKELEKLRAENAELRNPMTAKNECTHPELRAGTCLKCKKKVSARNVCDCGAINCTPSKPAQMTAKNEMPREKMTTPADTERERVECVEKD